MTRWLNNLEMERRTVEALQRSEAKFRTIFENAIVGIFQSTPEGRIITANPTCARIFGYESPEEMIASVYSITEQLYKNSEDREQWRKRIEQEGVVKDIEVQGKRKNGASFWFRFNARAILDDKGRITSYEGMVEDITERKKIEQELKDTAQRLQTIIDASPLAIIAIDNNDRVTMWNAAAERMFGWKKEEVMGLPLPIVPDDRGEEFQRIRETINRKESIQLEHSQRRKKDGSLIHVSLSVAPLTDNQGNITGRMGLFADITEHVKIEEDIKKTHQELQTALDIANKSRQALLSVIEDQKKAQEEIRRLNEELEERVRKRTNELEASNKELEAFTYSVSHDLKAPLRAIEGFTRILVENYGAHLDKEAQRICSVITENTQYMRQLIEDLLTLSRTGRVKITMSAVDMEQLVYAVFLELTTPEQRERIDLHVEPLPQVMGDPTLLRSVWKNLIENAIKFTAFTERAAIEIRGEEKVKEIIYSVKDNGIGFDMKYADKIFGVFQRLHGRDEFTGTGVGLAIVERIIHRHGGRVWAEGKEGKGATFWFSLPKISSEQ